MASFRSPLFRTLILLTSAATPAALNSTCRNAQQLINPRESLGRKTHGAFELVIALQDIRLPFPSSKRAPIHEPLHPRPMPENRDRIITAVHHSVGQRRLRTPGSDAPADGHIEGAVVSIEARVPFSHFN